SGAVKNQMLRMDPSFQERRLGFGSFSDFVKSRGGVVELDEAGSYMSSYIYMSIDMQHENRASRAGRRIRAHRERNTP
ncbi:OST-HTH/LOTUS domain-containing protein, partial [Agromyces humi]|uniref:OST-HTH/LOTUS domain-containing protein n=1 Tax=Agromyces humi TaxID=1766800 RepID=UPI0019398EFF